MVHRRTLWGRPPSRHVHLGSADAAVQAVTLGEVCRLRLMPSPPCVAATIANLPVSPTPLLAGPFPPDLDLAYRAGEVEGRNFTLVGAVKPLAVDVTELPTYAIRLENITADQAGVFVGLWGPIDSWLWGSPPVRQLVMPQAVPRAVPLDVGASIHAAAGLAIFRAKPTLIVRRQHFATPRAVPSGRSGPAPARVMSNAKCAGLMWLGTSVHGTGSIGLSH